MIYTAYSSVKALMQPGDLVVFREWPLDPLSGAIELATGGIESLFNKDDAAPSHCALIRMLISGRPQLIESTIRNGVDGVQSNYLDDRLADYGHGEAWWLPLTRAARKQFNYAMFYQAVESTVGNAYDVAGLVEFLFRRVAKLDEDKALMCSPACAAYWEAAGIISSAIDYAAISPEDLAAMPVCGPEYYQILGEQRELKARRGR